MKFTKTVDLWDPELAEAIRSGAMKLQRGQWVFCGDHQHRSRFVGVRQGGAVWAAHWQGSGRASQQRFKDLCSAFK